MTGAQRRALEVLAKGVPVSVSDETDFDEETVHWRPALWAEHAGYARRAGEGSVVVTEDGMVAARAEGVA